MPVFFRKQLTLLEFLCILIKFIIYYTTLLFFKVMNFTLLATVVLTAILFVAIVLVMVYFIAPRSYNEQQEEPYECGIPARGDQWGHYHLGYYLFAILFLMFDVETMFLFPWAAVASALGPQGLTAVLFFLFILVLGLAYAWRKGALKWH